jgi:hypothetical protein
MSRDVHREARLESADAHDNGPHPCEIGADWVARYFAVTENCARATQFKREQLPGQPR